MRGYDRLALTACFGLLLAGNSNVSDLETGRSIFQHGIGRDPIETEMFGQRVDNPDTFSCAACHGEYGTGGSEGGIAAPSLIVEDGLSQDAVEKWLDRALDGNAAQSQGQSFQRMPHYRMSARDRSALASYIRTFPNPPVPGLTHDRLVVGLDTTGMGLDEAGRAVLMREMIGLFAKLAGYGLFGRRIEVRDATGQTDQADLFAVIAWNPRAAIQAPLRVSVRPLAAVGKSDMCASVQPSLTDQYQMLTNYLDRLQVRYRTIRNDAATPFDLPIPANMAGAEDIDHDVDIDFDTGRAATGAKPVYLFADLIGPFASNRLPDNVHLIVPARIREQELAAKDIQSRNPVDPRSAGAIAMMKNAAQALFTTLARSGRRVSSRNACEELAKAMARFHHLDDMNNGTVSEIDP
ncbi:MAG: c-type cytochrome [Novosphingobium sp.]|nr:c-type cytochrome [Novosphingobium sp.]